MNESSSIARVRSRAWIPSLLFLAVSLLAAQTPPLAAQSSPSVRLILQPGSTVATVAGSGADARTLAGSAVTAALGGPRGLVYDAAGNLYIADARNHQVDRVATDGTLSIVVGTGRQAFTGDGGAATAASLNTPSAVAFDAAGNLLIADTGNHRIRVRMADGTITTIAGTGTASFGGDGGAATTAALRSPAGLAVDGSGNIFIADTGNHRVRRISAADGTISTVAGSGTEGDSGDGGSALAAALEAPAALTLLPDGRLLIADRFARRLRVLSVDGGTIAAYTPAGLPATRRPEGVTATASGSVYVADAGAQQVVQSSADGSAAVAGSGLQGGLTKGDPTATPLDSPAAVAVRSSDGTVAISDRLNHQVQQVTLASLNFGSVPAGEVSASQQVTLQNGGAMALQVIGVDLPAAFAVSSGSSTCAAVPFSLAPAATCVVGIAFAPTAQGAQSGSAQVRVAGAPPQALLLSGVGVAGGSLAGSATALSSNGTVSYVGSPVTFSAAVSGSVAAAPTGNVTFYDGSHALATVALTSGSASLSTAGLQMGAHAITANYSGDAIYSASTSSPMTETVVAAPDFTLSGGAGSYSGSAGGTIVIPLSLLPTNGTLNRPVQLAVSGLPAGATGTFLPSALVLAGDTSQATLTIKLPATLSQQRRNSVLPFVAAACLLCVLFSARRRRIAALLLLLVSLSAIGGCGGFRATTASNGSSGGTPSTYNYTAVVTATTTGITGDALVHTASFNLAVTP